MSFYEERILPHIINCACGIGPIEEQRQKVVPRAYGRVLEIGMGSGLNLPFYDKEKVEMIWGLEPSEGMRRRAQKNIQASGIKVEWLALPGEEIPLDDDTVDSVVLTYALCTIPDPHTALQQMKRVLKPDGALLFSEHGLSPDPKVQRWQSRLNPIWSKIAGGCNLNRPIDSLIQTAGFSLQKLDQSYIPGPKFASYQYWGRAKT